MSKLTIKILSLHCTWAGFIRAGALDGLSYKKHETRSRSSAIGRHYRGWLAIASTQKPAPNRETINQVIQTASQYFSDSSIQQRLKQPKLYQTGHILALARVVNAFEITSEVIEKQNPVELLTGDWQEVTPRRWAFELKDAIALPQPIPYKAKSQSAVLAEGDLQNHLQKIVRAFEGMAA